MFYKSPTPIQDHILADMLDNQKEWIYKYHEHDSLLENKIEEELSEADRKAAWDDYNAEKEGRLTYAQHNPNQWAAMVQDYQGGSTGMGNNVQSNMLLQVRLVWCTHKRFVNVLVLCMYTKMPVFRICTEIPYFVKSVKIGRTFMFPSVRQK